MAGSNRQARSESLRRAGGLALGLLIIATLGGCSTVDKVKGWLSLGPKPQPAAQQTAAIQPAPAPAAKPKRPPAHEAHEDKTPEKEPEKVAAIDPNSLIGLDPPAVERLLGAPTSVTKGDPSLVYSYATQGCVFRIIFYPDLKTASFHALKFGGVDDRGAELDPSQACIRSLLVAKSNGPG